MIFKAQELRAVSVTTPSGKKLVLVQVGDEWNGLVQFSCITPGDFHGHELIAVPKDHHGKLSDTLRSIFRLQEKEWLAVSTSPTLWLEMQPKETPQ